MQILLTGFFGEDNLGDDAILECILNNAPSDTKAVFTSGKSVGICPGARPISRRGLSSWPEYIKELANSSDVVFTGGILQDWSFEGVAYFALRILAANVFRKRISLWGAGLGPIKRPALQTMAQKALMRVPVAWLRDEYSKDFFEKLTKRKANLGTDWTWDIPVNLKTASSNINRQALNVRPWKFRKFGKLLNPHLLPNTETIGLAARNTDIKTMRKGLKNLVILKPESFSKATDMMNNFSCGILMRYHLSLAALRSGLSVKLIPYDEKIKSLARAARVHTIEESPDSPFLKASPEFIFENEQRMLEMKNAFVRFFERNRQ